MIGLRLDEVAAATGGRVIGDPAVRVETVTVDSRTVAGPAPLFVALRGEQADGHDHLAAAFAAGAAAALVERPDGVPHGVLVADTWRAVRDLAGAVRGRSQARAVAITGSVGKTTVKDLTAAAVRADRPTVSARGSFNNELGVPLTLLQLTPEAQVLVAEIGARHVGDIADLAPLVAAEVAVVTAVAGVHLEVFGTIDDVARGKRELVEALGPGGVAVLNGADPRVRAMASAAPAHLLVGGEGADVVAQDVTLDDAARPRFTARTPWGKVQARVPVAGSHQVTNALFALTVAGYLGVDLEVAADGLARAEVSRWRGEVRRAGEVTVLDDAYNANPTSVVAALDTLVALRRPPGRTAAVLGVMAEIGDTHEAEHERVGRTVAERGVDHLVVVGRDASGLAAGARDAGGVEIVEVPDAGAATAHLRAWLRPGDAVLVKASRVAGLESVAAALVPSAEGVGGAS